MEQCIHIEGWSGSHMRSSWYVRGPVDSEAFWQSSRVINRLLKNIKYQSFTSPRIEMHTNTKPIVPNGSIWELQWCRGEFCFLWAVNHRPDGTLSEICRYRKVFQVCVSTIAALEGVCRVRKCSRGVCLLRAEKVCGGRKRRHLPCTPLRYWTNSN